MLHKLDDITQKYEGWEVTFSHFPASNQCSLYIDDDQYRGTLSLSKLSLGEKELERTTFRKVFTQLESKQRVYLEPDWLKPTNYSERVSVALSIHDLTLPSSIYVFDLPRDFTGGFRFIAKRVPQEEEEYDQRIN